MSARLHLFYEGSWKQIVPFLIIFWLNQKLTTLPLELINDAIAVDIFFLVRPDNHFQFLRLFLHTLFLLLLLFLHEFCWFDLTPHLSSWEILVPKENRLLMYLPPIFLVGSSSLVLWSHCVSLFPFVCALIPERVSSLTFCFSCSMLALFLFSFWCLKLYVHYKL